MAGAGCLPASCKAAVSWCFWTPSSIRSSSELMLLTTSPSSPTSAMPFQKASVSSAGTRVSHSLAPPPRPGRVSHLRSRRRPSAPLPQASSSPASRSRRPLCPRRRCPGPPELGGGGQRSPFSYAVRGHVTALRAPLLPPRSP